MKVKEGVHDAFDDPRLVRVMFAFVCEVTNIA